MILLQKAKARIFADVINGKVYKAGGLLPHEEDARDLNLGIFGLGTYKTKQDDLIIKTLSIKDQAPFNTCAWNAITVQKEMDEQKILSVEKLVEKGKQLGLLSGDGFSSLRDNQDIVRKFGIPEDVYSSPRTYSWSEYSRYKWNAEIEANAFSHRSASYWNTKSKNDVLKFLDQGKVFQTGMEWYTGMNQSGGFGSNGRYIIEKLKGTFVGGHAFVCIGYVKNYAGYGLCLVFQNSFGPNWGDRSLFYMPIDFATERCYTFYAQLDIEVDVGRFLTKYEGKFVKAKTGPAIYMIKDGAKCAFPDMTTYFAWGGARKGYDLIVDNSEIEQLSQVPDGGILEIQYSPFWPMIRNLTGNVNELVRVVNEALEFEKNFSTN